VAGFVTRQAREHRLAGLLELAALEGDQGQTVMQRRVDARIASAAQEIEGLAIDLFSSV
jgi:hypothetical protein